MVTANTEVQRTAFTVSVDFRHGTTTGISAADRSATIQALVDPHTRPTDLNRPGPHLPPPLPAGRGPEAGRPHRGRRRPGPGGRAVAGRRAVRGGERGQGHHGPAARARGVRRASTACHLISIADLIRYRRHKDKLVRRIADARIPTDFGEFTVYAYESVLDGEHHVALVKGDIQGQPNTLVRVHSECLTGDVFGSLRCDCGPQLARGHAGHRARTAAACWSTCAATRAAASAWPTSCGPTTSRRRASTRSTPTSSSGLPVDSREYGIGAQILVDLGRDHHAAHDQQPDQVRRARGLRPRHRRAGQHPARRPPPRTSSTCGPSASAWATCSRGSMTSSDQTALPDDAKARAAARVGSSLDPGELVPDGRADVRVGFACAEFNGGITDRLLTAALDELERRRRATSAASWWPGRRGPSSSRSWPAAWSASRAGRRRGGPRGGHPGRHRPLRLRGRGVRVGPPAGPARHRRCRWSSAC